ncbi:hypothetical protein HAX54_026273, partial [Datura stramonium]|nr:hypothetical protein [Datura stramonium]
SWNCFGNDDIRLFAGRVRCNADGMSIQTPVGFRPLLGIRITLAVCGSELTTRCLVAGGVSFCPTYYFALVSQQRSADNIWRLAGASP